MNVKVTGAVFCLLLLVAVSLSEQDDTLIDLEEERFERSPLEAAEEPEIIHNKKKRAFLGRSHAKKSAEDPEIIHNKKKRAFLGRSHAKK